MVGHDRVRRGIIRGLPEEKKSCRMKNPNRAMGVDIDGGIERPQSLQLERGNDGTGELAVGRVEPTAEGQQNSAVTGTEERGVGHERGLCRAREFAEQEIVASRLADYVGDGRANDRSVLVENRQRADAGERIEGGAKLRIPYLRRRRSSNLLAEIGELREGDVD